MTKKVARVLSALTLDLAVAIERDLLRRDDIHLVAARSIAELVTLSRDGAALCLVEPLLPDGDAHDAVETLAALDPPIPVVLVVPRDAPVTGTIDQGFAAVLSMPDPSFGFAEIIARLLGAPRRRGVRRGAAARARDHEGKPFGRVVDLSLGGVALRSRRSLAMGETLAFTLELVIEDISVPACAEVVRIDDDVAALRFVAPSPELSAALERTLAAHFPTEGFSFRPSVAAGARDAAIGGVLAGGPALTAFAEHMAEGDTQARLAIHELAPFDERGVDRWISLVGQLPGVELRGCPPWFVALAARLPALLGRAPARARLFSMQLALHCATCGDEPLDEARWTAPTEARGGVEACLARPCYVCGGTLALEEPLEQLLAVFSR